MHRRSTFAVGACLALAALGGCSRSMTTSDADVQRLEYEQLVELVQEEGDVVLVDVRRPAVYADVHLPEAINLPLSAMRPGLERLAEADTIVVYGEDPFDSLVLAGAKRLIALGYEDVRAFSGGMADWQRLGGPTTRTLGPQQDRPERR